MNWFQRHVNLSLILGYILGGFLLPAILIPNVIAFSKLSGGSSGPPVTISLAVIVVFMLAISAWTLWQKGRSLFWLFLVLAGPLVAVIVYACLSDRGPRATQRAMRSGT